MTPYMVNCMTVYLYKFKKRRNSTLRPEKNSGYQVDVSLRLNVPVSSPASKQNSSTTTYHTLFLNWNTTSASDILGGYNYMQWGDYYYFIDSIEFSIGNEYVIQASIDALATLKDHILSTTQKVLFSSSNYNLMLDDRRNGVSLSHTMYSSESALFTNKNGGTYILYCTGKGQADGGGATEIYLMPSGSWRALAQALVLTMDDLIPTQDFASMSITEALGALLNYCTDTAMNVLLHVFGNPISAIYNAKWTALDIYSYLPGEVDVLYLLGYNMHIGCKRVMYEANTIPLITFTAVVSVPKPYSDYRLGSRFCSYSIMIPYCGIFELSADELVGYNYLMVAACIDPISLNIAGWVAPYDGEGPTDKFLLGFGGNCSSDIPIGSGIDATGAAVLTAPLAITAGITTTVGSWGGIRAGGQIPTKDFLGGLAKGAIKGAMVEGSGVANLTHASTMSGGSISSAAGFVFGTSVVLTCDAHASADSPTAIKDVRGLPCEKTLPLGGLTGFCQCDNPSIPCDEPFEIVDAAENLMTQGFYIE